MSNYKLLGVGTNAKTIKGDGSEYLTAILYMTPYKIMVDGNLFNSCSMAAMASCIDACLYTAGRGKFSNVQSARQRKAQLFYKDRQGFMEQLIVDVAKFANYCRKRDIQPCVRLNGTTDIRWELIKIEGKNIFELFPNVQFYDYTKISNRKVADYPNYHLTWSYSNANPEYAKLLDKIIEGGMNVAVVFRSEYKKSLWCTYPVVDGDKDDLRFLDPKGRHIVALYAKGRAKKDTSGFVQEV
tara:strand:- start:160 stop:882 length:723 start_codon:yes stop_codon:yes gene_type:complete